MFRKVIAILMIICCCAPFCACQQEEQPSQTGFVKSVYTFEKTISPVRMQSVFGVVELNEEPAFVSEGRQSIRLTPKTPYADRSYVFFPFSSSALGFNYTDLNFISAVDVDVYTPIDITMAFGMYFSDTGTLRAEPTTITLKPGWTTVNISVQHSLIALQYDLMNCKGLYVQVGTEAVTLEESVYLDNICLTVETQPAEVEANILIDEWDGYCELADFEHAYQQIIAMPYTTYNRAALPEVKVVDASEYGLEAPSGKRVLRIESYPRNGGAAGSWTQLAFTDQWFTTLDIGRFKGQGYELKFDVYQEGNFSTLIELNLYHAYGMDWGGIQTKQDQWVEFSEPLDTYANWLDNPKQFVFAWMDWDPALGDKCVFYIDNIRIEKTEQ